MYNYKSKLIRVIDGDTVELLIDLGCSVHIKQTIRLLGINAPERKQPTFKEAVNSTIRLDYLIRIASDSNNLLIITKKDKSDKYGRLLGTLYDMGNDTVTYDYYKTRSFEESINYQMLNEGYAVASPNSWNK